MFSSDAIEPLLAQLHGITVKPAELLDLANELFDDPAFDPAASQAANTVLRFLHRQNHDMQVTVAELVMAASVFVDTAPHKLAGSDGNDKPLQKIDDALARGLTNIESRMPRDRVSQLGTLGLILACYEGSLDASTVTAVLIIAACHDLIERYMSSRVRPQIHAAEPDAVMLTFGSVRSCHQQLGMLLQALFDAPELERFVCAVKALAPEQRDDFMPSANIPLTAQVTAIVDAFARRKLIPLALQQLELERPRARDQIRVVRQCYNQCNDGP